MKNYRVGNVFLFAPIIKQANLNVYLSTVYFLCIRTSRTPIFRNYFTKPSPFTVEKFPVFPCQEAILNVPKVRDRERRQISEYAKE